MDCNDSLGEEAAFEAMMDAHIGEMTRENQHLISRGKITLHSNRPKFQKEIKPDAVITLDSTGMWISCQKDEGWLEAFKSAVPWSDRDWVPAETSWFVSSERHMKNVLGITQLFFENVAVIDLRNE